MEGGKKPTLRSSQNAIDFAREMRKLHFMLHISVTHFDVTMLSFSIVENKIKTLLLEENLLVMRLRFV